MARKHSIEFYEQPKSPSQRWFWRMRAPNGKIIADGSEGYYCKSTIKRAMRRFCEATGFNGSIVHVAPVQGTKEWAVLEVIQ